MSRLRITDIPNNIKKAPPMTGSGIVINKAPNFVNIAKTIMNAAEHWTTLRLPTYTTTMRWSMWLQYFSQTTFICTNTKCHCYDPPLSVSCLIICIISCVAIVWSIDCSLCTVIVVVTLILCTYCFRTAIAVISCILHLLFDSLVCGPVASHAQLVFWPDYPCHCSSFDHSMYCGLQSIAAISCMMWREYNELLRVINSRMLTESC